ncbi:MAG: pilus assembly protein [Burkholderiales bacterium]|nr:pilus assembly protein [Burkholderiales bacterium]
MPSISSTRARSRLSSSIAFALALLAASAACAQGVDLADKPLFSTTSVPGNLLLSLSVEYPTANTSAYFSTTPYASATLYLGYFDGAKCYRYLYDGASPANSYFQSYSAASASHQCASSSSQPLWSGNYLNYAAMQSLDIFRWVMTGGNRLVDTAGTGGTTILQKATHSGQGGAGDAPNKKIPFADQTGSTPFSWANGVKSRIWGAGIKLWLTGSADLDASSITAVDYQDSLMANGSPDGSAVYALYMNVRVCDAAVSLEANCVAYGNQSKPEGLMQQYAGSLRYSAFAYLNDSSATRDGGVMRARMAYIGPKVPQPGAAATSNPNPEWDASTGVMIANPDPADATATNTSTSNRTAVSQSGVLNYLNKFGYASGTYKTYDPVSELYYASLRYLKGQANVAAYADMSDASAADAGTWADGFPVVTDWSTDPIIYACQKNFILGIGDVNTHRDANLPGSSLRSRAEPARPPEITADASGSAAVDVTTSTNLVGTLENPANTKLGSTVATGDHGTYYIAGLAYDAHLPIAGKGVRTFTDAATGLTTVSTASTYWLDVLEYQAYVDNNQYYYATKYGGFTVPTGYAYGGALPADSWYNSTNTLGGNKQPDNYFTASNATLMQSGLTNAFAKIVSENNAANGTALSLPTPNVGASGTMSYSSTYDPTSWTGQVIGSTVTFNADGTSTVTQQWDARALLSASNVTADTRRIVTCCTLDAASPGLPFTLASLRAASLDARTYYASFGNVPGVAAASQSIANYIAYLRGDKSNETSNGGVYRTRKFRLGDIVDAKPAIVGPPNSGFYDTYNAGYAAFRTRYLNRRNVVYAGANDGMLHAFDGTAGSTSPVSGSELFAYIPSFVYGNAGSAATTGLAALGNPGFSHHYLVDATPGAFDIDLDRTSGATGDPDWRTLLIGGLGKGGKGYYALDVTDPSSWSDEATVASKVMWEFTDSRMGYGYGTPTVAKTRKYGWVVIFTSGYSNADGRGYFFIVNPSSGALLEAVATAAGTGSTSSPLNMGQATAYIENYADMTADAIYAGDLQGNVWRLDLSATDVTQPYPAPTRIASLTDARGNVQPITTRPLVEVAPNSSTRYVLVGTGRLLADSDISSGAQQSFYAFVDGLSASGAFYGAPSQPLPSGVSFPITRSQLNQDTSVLTGIGSAPSSAMGWYLDLSVSGGIAERVNVDPIASQGVVAFIGNQPNGSACSPSGNGTLHALRFATGQTTLVGADLVTLAASAALSGIGTDVAIVNVDGKAEVTSGSSKGNVKRDNLQQDSAGAIKQINWRDVPGTN